MNNMSTDFIKIKEPTLSKHSYSLWTSSGLDMTNARKALIANDYQELPVAIVLSDAFNGYAFAVVKEDTEFFKLYINSGRVRWGCRPGNIILFEGSLASVTDPLSFYKRFRQGLELAPNLYEAVELTETEEKGNFDMESKEFEKNDYDNEILVERENTYGDPTAMHERIAKIWSGVLGHEVTALEVSLCMVGLKLARAQKNPNHDDSIIDALGYSEIAKIIQSKSLPTE